MMGKTPQKYATLMICSALDRMSTRVQPPLQVYVNICGMRADSLSARKT